MEKTDPQKVFSDLHTYGVACTHSHAHTYNKMQFKIIIIKSVVVTGCSKTLTVKRHEIVYVTYMHHLPDDVSGKLV